MCLFLKVISIAKKKKIVENVDFAKLRRLKVTTNYTSMHNKHGRNRHWKLKKCVSMTKWQKDSARGCKTGLNGHLLPWPTIFPEGPQQHWRPAKEKPNFVFQEKVWENWSRIFASAIWSHELQRRSWLKLEVSLVNSKSHAGEKWVNLFRVKGACTHPTNSSYWAFAQSAGLGGVKNNFKIVRHACISPTSPFHVIYVCCNL